MYFIAVESRTPCTEDLPEWPQLVGRAPQIQATTPSGSENRSPTITSYFTTITPTHSPDGSSPSTITGTAAPHSSEASSGVSSFSSHPNALEEKGTKVKSTLEYIFLILALLLFGVLVLRRLRDLRRRGLPLAAFFAFTRSSHPSRGPGPDIPNQTRSFPRTTGLPRIALMNGYPIYPNNALIPGLPVAYTPHRRGRRTHASDIGVGGRRSAGINVDFDHDGPLSDKDVLPAYETFGGPPKYDDAEIQETLSQSFNTINSDSYHSWATTSSNSETDPHYDASPPGLACVESSSHPPMTEQAPTPTAIAWNAGISDAITRTRHASA
ncbi:hypothetical protein CPB83DRAFT_906539 [Crepidotus variabilis]|uniref:Uncharacterized protein n=1 Tax=Crepidotus variabilis TaxID=179855 RepID=A0A9P6EGW9_9AGAR|nr:hypothetical protein CPB83DRAFT_906539 [Crepidotus variabilis]